MESRGILFVLSGPSGAGKGTVLNSVFQDINDIVCSVSATTRKPRSREVDGKNYFFLAKEEFEKKINDGELLEYVEKFGNYYGTLKSYVQSILDSGKDVLLEIETIGAEKIRSHPDLKKENLVFIFLTPSNVFELAQRLKGRNSEDKESLEARIRIGFDELESINDYDYIVINDDLSDATREVKSIIHSERCRVSRNGELIRKVLTSVKEK